MAKEKESKQKYSLEDFYSKTKQESGIKVHLKIGEEDTGHYLIAKGLSSRSIANEKLNWQVSYARVVEQSEDIKDKIDRSIHIAKEKKKLDDKLACMIVSGWSFDDECTEEAKAKLFDENEELSGLVIDCSANTDAYLEKK